VAVIAFLFWLAYLTVGTGIALLVAWVIRDGMR
jgi:hypothetical protein